MKSCALESFWRIFLALFLVLFLFLVQFRIAPLPGADLPPAAPREELDRFLARWAESHAGLKTLAIRFNQETKFRILFAMRFPLVLSLLSFPYLFGADLPPAAPREELDRFLARWAESHAGLKTLAIRFQQEKRLRILRKPLLSSGTIRLDLASSRLRCTVLDPDGKIDSELLAEKTAVHLFYPGLKKVEIYDLGAGAAPPVAFPGLGGDIEALRRDYEVALHREKGADRLVLTPKSPGAPMRRMELVLKEFAVKEMVQVDKSGDSVRLIIEEFRKNPPLAPGDFDLAIPPGTEETRPLGKKSAEKKSEKRG